MPVTAKQQMLSFRGFLNIFSNNQQRTNIMNLIYRHVSNIQKVFLLYCLSVFNAAHASNSIDKNWQFTVYLDGDEIGFHNFSIIQKEEYQEIYSSARFNVKFLFINAYSYKHDNVELWQGQCLNSINAVTDDNGDLYNVSGEAEHGAFIVNTTENDYGEKQNQYLPCIKTFAYWDPEFLKETSLLNSQTGEMVEVDSEFIGNDTLKYKGEEITARHYRLHGKDLQIDLWYSVDNHWLALESLTESGRVVRYAM
jgi:hypothetical protein